ncbi:hypothetical protein ABZ419_11140 [Streptomyces cinnamoneus]|uniref:hypothetical protein n=1 Tax=Streptomyces cinnamoneus TaxID=53446 RepID=UPI0033F3CEA2
MSEMQRLALEEAALKALADEVGDRLKTVRASMQEAMETSGASRVEALLPGGPKVATISRTSPRPEAVVTDQAEFLAWVREHSPANITSRLVTEVRPAFQSALLAEMTAAGIAQWADRETGEVHEVPGVEIRATRGRTHSVRPVDGGREAIAEAWRDGRLTHLALPQITAGEAS